MSKYSPDFSPDAAPTGKAPLRHRQEAEAAGYFGNDSWDYNNGPVPKPTTIDLIKEKVDLFIAAEKETTQHANLLEKFFSSLSKTRRTQQLFNALHDMALSTDIRMNFEKGRSPLGLIRATTYDSQHISEKGDMVSEKGQRVIIAGIQLDKYAQNTLEMVNLTDKQTLHVHTCRDHALHADKENFKGGFFGHNLFIVIPQI